MDSPKETYGMDEIAKARMASFNPTDPGSWQQSTTWPSKADQDPGEKPSLGGKSAGHPNGRGGYRMRIRPKQFRGSNPQNNFVSAPSNEATMDHDGDWDATVLNFANKYRPCEKALQDPVANVEPGVSGPGSGRLCEKEPITDSRATDVHAPSIAPAPQEEITAPVHEQQAEIAGETISEEIERLEKHANCNCFFCAYARKEGNSQIVPAAETSGGGPKARTKDTTECQE